MSEQQNPLEQPKRGARGRAPRLGLIARLLAGAARWTLRALFLIMLAATLWPGRPYELDLASHFVQHVAAVFLCAAAAAAVARKWRCVTEITLYACTLAAISLGARWMTSAPSPANPDRDAQVLRIVSYNAKWTKEHDDEAFLQWLRAQDADLISLFAPPWPLLASDPWLRETYPHRVEPAQGLRWLTVLLSKAPVTIERIGERTPETQRSFVARRSMILSLDDGRTLLFTGMRPPSPRTLAFWRQSLEEADRDGRVLREFHEHTGAMIIAAGDFNSTPTGRLHHTFARSSGLKAWTTPVGAGTWPAWAPTLVSLPIDRVWVSEGLRIRWAQVGPVFGSDHRPVVFEIELGTAP